MGFIHLSVRRNLIIHRWSMLLRWEIRVRKIISSNLVKITKISIVHIWLSCSRCSNRKKPCTFFTNILTIPSKITWLKTPMHKSRGYRLKWHVLLNVWKCMGWRFTWKLTILGLIKMVWSRYLWDLMGRKLIPRKICNSFIVLRKQG